MRSKFVMVAATAAAFFFAPASAQMPDMALMNKWSSVTIVHYEAVGVLSDKHVQIPADDADQYGDVVEKVTLSFDWDKSKGVFIGAPAIANAPAEVSNLTGMGDNCPAGEMQGPYEHFDAVELKSNGSAIEVIGVRKHPNTMVAESCGAGRKLYKAAETSVSTWISPPDPIMLAYGKLLGEDTGMKISADGKSLTQRALNNNWVWTYTPTAK